MRTLIMYLCSCFCKHQWQKILEKEGLAAAVSSYSRRTVQVFRCEKCGAVQKIKTVW